MDFVESACICALVLRKRKRRREFWVHPLISSRVIDGQFYKLFDNLKKYPIIFFNYFRMSEESFERLLVLIQTRIMQQDTHLRLAVPPHSPVVRGLTHKNRLNRLKICISVKYKTLNKK